MGIMGLPNTGKSHSRSFIKDGSDCFVLAPSMKFSHLFKGEGDARIALPPFDMKANGATWAEVAKKAGMTKNQLIHSLAEGDLPPGLEMQGNSALVASIDDIGYFLKFIDRHMPHIKNVWLADFTHWMSNVISTSRFQNRKAGGEAFAKWWELAANVLNNILRSIEQLEREDLMVITEFHAQLPDQAEGELFYEPFVPGGKMLNNAFLPKSYFDVMLCSHVEPYADDLKEEDRFKFVITRKAPYDGRAMGLFNDIAEKGMIPNDMQLVLDRVRKHYNI